MATRLLNLLEIGLEGCKKTFSIQIKIEFKHTKCLEKKQAESKYATGKFNDHLDPPLGNQKIILSATYNFGSGKKKEVKDADLGDE